jgi:hypothetical protein
MNFRAALLLLSVVLAVGYVAANIPEFQSALLMLVANFGQAEIRSDQLRPIVVLDSW